MVKHTIEIQGFQEKEFLIIQEVNKELVKIRIVEERFENNEEPLIVETTINKEQLHSFIGTLLHVQSKMK
jgi:hypothetical protein